MDMLRRRQREDFSNALDAFLSASRILAPFRSFVLTYGQRV
jgi:hypothetical protein